MVVTTINNIGLTSTTIHVHLHEALEGSFLYRNEHSILGIHLYCGPLLCMACSSLGLHVKLSWGIKLCKLQGRFLARVNNVNYIVNYKIFARARDLNKSRASFFFAAMAHNAMTLRALQLYTHLFNSKTLPASLLSTSSFATTPILLTLEPLDFFTGEIGPSARISASSSEHKSTSSSWSIALDRGRVKPWGNVRVVHAICGLDPRVRL